MSEFVYWEVSKEAEGCNDETVFYFQNKENALDFAKALVLKIKPRIPAKVYMSVSRADNESLEMQLGVPEIVVDEWRVTAIYPTVLLLGKRERVVLLPEIKEEGKPYRPEQSEERVSIKKLGCLYVEHSAFGPEQFYLEEKDSNSFWSKRKEWKASSFVSISRKVIETKD